MDRAWESGAIATAPTAGENNSIGFPTGGSDALAATAPGPYLYHMLIEEPRNVILAAGLTPDKSNLFQLRDSILILSASGSASQVQTISLTGTQNNVPLTPARRLLVRLANGSDTIFTGFVAGQNGDEVVFVSISNGLSTFSHANGASVAANQIGMQGAANLVIAPGGTFVMRYDSSSNIWRHIYAETATTRNVYEGIRFPATQLPSTNVNTLDDYKQFQSWSPVIGGTTSESGQSYSVQSGRGVKFGDRFEFTGQATFSAKGTIVGDIVIKNLPLPNSGGHRVPVLIGFEQLGINYIGLDAYVEPGATTITIRAATAATNSIGSSIATAAIQDTTSIWFSGSFFTAT